MTREGSSKKMLQRCRNYSRVMHCNLMQASLLSPMKNFMMFCVSATLMGRSWYRHLVISGDVAAQPSIIMLTVKHFGVYN